jgi:hypothetical protein
MRMNSMFHIDNKRSFSLIGILTVVFIVVFITLNSL